VDAGTADGLAEVQAEGGRLMAGVKKIRTTADANAMFLTEHSKRERQLGAMCKTSGKDEAVIRKASERDRLKFIPRRLN
jgi:hypothetical protein